MNCSIDISNNAFFYTLAKSMCMFGFFCCLDCAGSSEINHYLNAYAVKINSKPETHRQLVAIPDVKVIKQYQEEIEKRKLWKKYLS